MKNNTVCELTLLLEGSMKMNELLFPDHFMRSFIGADRLRALNDRVSSSNYTSNFPPHNIEQVDQNKYVLTFALAGYSPEDLTISVHGDVLTIENKKKEVTEENKTYLHRAISYRQFTRKFVLGEYIEVISADMQNGLLSISLERVVPESAKPKHIPISSTSTASPEVVYDEKKKPLKVVNG
jgi:molecular chaperone IbpA